MKTPQSASHVNQTHTKHPPIQNDVLPGESLESAPAYGDLVSGDQPITAGMVRSLQQQVGNRATLQLLRTRPQDNMKAVGGLIAQYSKPTVQRDPLPEEEPQNDEAMSEQGEQMNSGTGGIDPPDDADNNNPLQRTSDPLVQRSCGCTGACTCGAEQDNEQSSDVQRQTDTQASLFPAIQTVIPDTHALDTDENTAQTDRPVQRVADLPTGKVQRGFFSSVKKGAKKLGKSIKKGAKKVGGSIKKGAKWVGDKAKNAALPMLKKMAEKLIKPVKWAVSTAYNKGICPLIGKLTPQINFDLSKYIPIDFEKVKAFVRALIRGAIDGISKTIEFLKDLAGNIKKLLSGIFGKVWNMIDAAMKKFSAGIGNIFGKIGLNAPNVMDVEMSELPGLKELPEIPGLPTGDQAAEAVGDKADTGQAYLMTGGHKINQWRSALKKQSASAKGKLGSMVSSVVDPVRDYAISTMTKCVENIPVLDSVVNSAKKLKEKFMRMVVVAGDVVMTEAVDTIVRDAECSDGESKATIKAGASVPVPYLPKANLDGSRAVEITKRDGGKVAFKHIQSTGLSANKGGASAGVGVEDGETYVYDRNVEGEMFNAGLTTFYKQAQSNVSMFAQTELFKGTAESATGLSLGDKKNFESSSTGFYANIAVVTDKFEFMSGGKAILEEFKTGDKKISTEISGKIKLQVGDDYKIGDNDNFGDMDKNLGADLAATEIDGATMAIEVNVGADGSVKDVSYIIKADTPTEAITRKLFGVIDVHEKLEQGAEKKLNKKYNRKREQEKLDVDIGESQAGTYEIRYTVTGGGSIDTDSLKAGDFTDFQNVANQIKDSGQLMYIRKGEKQMKNIAVKDKKSGISGTLGLTQETACEI